MLIALQTFGVIVTALFGLVYMAVAIARVTRPQSSVWPTIIAAGLLTAAWLQALIYLGLT